MDSTLEKQQINGADIFRWFVSGATEVASHVRYINKINVFPVADGDTGTNMATTLRAMVDRASPSASFSHTLQSISTSGMEGARGNSGILFASYVNGLALESGKSEHVSIPEFARVVFEAVQHLYAAVDNPREGTLLTVIRDWARFIQTNNKAYLTFEDLLRDAYQTAAASLERTRTQMEVLRRHNVVDAGAAGFVRFLEGINRVLSSRGAEYVLPEPPMDDVFVEEINTTARYCTEALVALTPCEQGDADVAEAVRKMLHIQGDSLIVAVRDGRLKVHIHTNNPEMVMQKLLPYGRLIEQKADDMLLQTRLRVKTVGGVGILTDSIADLPEDFLLEHGVPVLPMGVLAKDTVFLDKITMRLPQLFPFMNSVEGYPTSSQPEPGRIRTWLSMALEHFDSLIVVSVSQKLSGTYQAVAQAAEALQTPQQRISVVDTRLNSGAQGLLVKRAVEWAEQGKMHDEILAELQRMIPATKIYVCLNTLAYAVRGGRVPNTIGQLGMKMGLRPIMTLDAQGRGAAFGVAFSQTGLTRKILRKVQKVHTRRGVEAYGIVHGGNPALAQYYQTELTRITGLEPAFVSEISAVVALHAGPGTVAVCFTQKEA